MDEQGRESRGERSSRREKLGGSKGRDVRKSEWEAPTLTNFDQLVLILLVWIK